MRIVIFGLAISSSWGNGHATLWRGLVKALARRGCRVEFFERDEPYYANTRDFMGSEDVSLVLYADFDAVRNRAAKSVHHADVVIFTSYCPDGAAAAELAGRGGQARILYDLDTPVTLELLERGERPAFVSRRGLSDYDLVLSFAGGRALDGLRRHGAQRAMALYGFVDPEVHRPAEPDGVLNADLSYIGTYAPDRQAALTSLFLEPARRNPDRSFLLAGAQYPSDFPWRPNVRFVRHLPPDRHPVFFSSSRLTLNVTRGVMKELGWCPSGRLFEAAACGTPIVSDRFDGLERFFEPGQEIIVARDSATVDCALGLSDRELGRMAAAARERVLAGHTADARAGELLQAVSALSARLPTTTPPPAPAHELAR